MINQYLGEVAEIALKLDQEEIAKLIGELHILRERGGRVFVLGVGGSAANASHLVNDLRKLCDIEAYTPVDNVSELTARTNDDGWEHTFAPWLSVSKLKETDAILVLSVGGGSAEKNVSPNLVEAIDYAKYVGARILGIVGRDGGHTALHAHACVVVPTVNPEHVTPHTEAFQAVIWHCVIWGLKVNPGKWESQR